MKCVFPIILTKGSEKGYIVYVPSLDINTEGDSIADAIFMARDAIGLWGLCQSDLGKEIPEVTNLDIPHKEGEIVTLVDVDFDAYKRAHDNRTVRKNLTIPAWLNDMAEKNGVNFSQILQRALKEELHITNS